MTLTRILVFLFVLISVSSAYSEGQSKPEFANATKVAKGVWESAPAEKTTIWLQR